MNVDHFGIFVTFIVLVVLLSIVFLAQSNISILPETQHTVPQNSTAFAEYCKQLILKC